MRGAFVWMFNMLRHKVLKLVGFCELEYIVIRDAFASKGTFSLICSSYHSSCPCHVKVLECQVNIATFLFAGVSFDFSLCVLWVSRSEICHNTTQFWFFFQETVWKSFLSYLLCTVMFSFLLLLFLVVFADRLSS